MNDEQRRLAALTDKEFHKLGDRTDSEYIIELYNRAVRLEARMLENLKRWKRSPGWNTNDTDTMRLDYMRQRRKLQQGIAWLIALLETRPDVAQEQSA